MAEAEPGLVAQLLGRAAYEFSTLRSSSMLPTYLHLIVSALFPIYAGAHASLSRPSSAAKPTKKKRTTDGLTAHDDDDDDDEPEQHVMEGLSPKDALLMPLFAGTALASLYFLLKWMKDPALLNKILNAYFAIFGVFSVSRLITDALDAGHSIIFPQRYALNGALYHIDDKEEKALPVAGDTKDKQPILSPFPGFLARIPLSAGARQFLWNDRAMPGNKWTLRVYLHRMGADKFKVGPHGIVGVLIGLSTVLYFNLVDKPWYLTNLLGFGFSYGALQLMSPTTFTTGSMILSALFFYDIYFVFYTPMMVTVAKSLDVPIKLMFPRPGPADSPSAPPSHAMLGLGDVVLPGIMIGLALRFDLYLFYLRRQKRVPAMTTSEVDTVEKPQYFSLAGRWTDYFWTHSLTGRPLWIAPKEQAKLETPFTFPKTYFKASLVGYVAGLLATLGVMMVWNHAQPALLYLVPGVLGSLWLTALARGELSLMWSYTEEVEEEDENKNKADGNKDGSADKASSNNTSSQLNAARSEPEDDRTRQTQQVGARRSDREVFSFSITAPWQLKQTPSSPIMSKDGQKPDESHRLSGEKHNWAPTKVVGQVPDAEPTGKRVRLN
ncbi:hypothetical protein P153DRAFT_313465 [Dothidotthia symphoricarpi CBS 119687]|uniref:Intramembrane protease 2 n=1 Tax=Dothidotthia symphoricarpi CBS 119687 TaxID=1392245 RepID=A0A6A6AJM8_9PLEO|nr:uncharacterized protein P153DRAFT_313465 [Dothidotthia symphoricarpi CBS 119687]KAF2131114.1 hypothetical protein P153DRAFT_313465 [Dothidotthia symphoricarpi CBS 119687]